MSLQEKILKRKLKKKEKQKLKVIEERKTAKLDEEDAENIDENETQGVKRKFEDTESPADSENPENLEAAAPTEKKKKKKKSMIYISELKSLCICILQEILVFQF